MKSTIFTAKFGKYCETAEHSALAHYEDMDGRKWIIWVNSYMICRIPSASYADEMQQFTKSDAPELGTVKSLRDCPMRFDSVLKLWNDMHNSLDVPAISSPFCAEIPDDAGKKKKSVRVVILKPENSDPSPVIIDQRYLDLFIDPVAASGKNAVSAVRFWLGGWKDCEAMILPIRISAQDAAVRRGVDGIAAAYRREA